MKANARIRRVAVTVALLLAGSTMALPASAQEWPARTVTVVVPLGAGSATDIMARVVADQLSKQLDRTFVVENRPGAGGTIGAGMVAEVGAGRLHDPRVRRARDRACAATRSFPTTRSTISCR